MLVQIGQRRTPEDVVDLLEECHQRIRRFLSLARQIATGEGVADDVVRSVAGQVQRYFAVAFPLHLADEEELVAPRLAGASGEVDRALATMRSDHAAHEATVTRLAELCAVLARDPRPCATSRGELTATAAELAAGLEPHLELEERVIFPAIRCLPASEREAIHRGMRVRRERALDPSA